MYHGGTTAIRILTLLYRVCTTVVQTRHILAKIRIVFVPRWYKRATYWSNPYQFCTTVVRTRYTLSAPRFVPLQHSSTAALQHST
ncbi:hypothetical protein BIFGAL_03101 [Bifidobacterium gallicum DSM 20093 = LMG 11596]|uniref:Uncharacterized protein n=1 Tax=Bifidobacterium gallicum DSM 20093 = LMG 11596 TaxID=561180 RepID=D1NTE4_9BIFI|nr:hypothetical protein BIFGAL_03101 [Bifidobacterium gallicum DSM 20093 = LMG 11596]